MVLAVKDGELRLTGGDSSRGTVEFSLNGVWGTICDNEWNIVNADIACSMLGFKRALRALKGSSFGEGTSPVLLDNVRCETNQKSISRCTHDVTTRTRCGRGKDASVVCLDESLPGKISYFFGFALLSLLFDLPALLFS